MKVGNEKKKREQGRSHGWKHVRKKAREGGRKEGIEGGAGKEGEWKNDRL
jgi:hypothetical protein